MLSLENLALRPAASHGCRPRSSTNTVPSTRAPVLSIAVLYRCRPGCLQTLQLFQPDTLVRWHRKGFRGYWRWKSRRGRGGRPKIDTKVRQLIRTMSRENIGWGAPASARLEYTAS